MEQYKEWYNKALEHSIKLIEERKVNYANSDLNKVEKQAFDLLFTNMIRDFNDLKFKK